MVAVGGVGEMGIGRVEFVFVVGGRGGVFGSGFGL